MATSAPANRSSETPRRRGRLDPRALGFYLAIAFGLTWVVEISALVARGVRVGKERVRKLMAQHGIRAKHKRKYIATTNSNHNLPVAPNLLERNFTATAPNQVWW